MTARAKLGIGHPGQEIVVRRMIHMTTQTFALSYRGMQVFPFKRAFLFMTGETEFLPRSPQQVWIIRYMRAMAA